MGLFIRKAFSFGPIRFNLSKWGLGASIGVRGLRLGQRPNRRWYLFARLFPGLYYRRDLPVGDKKEQS